MTVRVLIVNHGVELGGAELALLALLGRRPPDASVTLAVPREGPLSQRARALDVRVEVSGPGEGILGYRRHAVSLSPLRATRALAELGAATVRLRRLARAHDLVVTNSTKAHLYGGAAARLAGRPCVWRLHDVVDTEGFSPAVERLLLEAARRLPRRVVAVSQAAAAPLRRAGCPQVVVEPNGVDLRALSAPAEARQSVRAGLDVPPDAKVALMLGRLTPLKGAEVLFAAMQEVPGLMAVLAGQPSYSEVADYGARLRERAAPLSPRVVFAGFRRDVGAMLAAADVLVHPCVKPDSLPTAVLEAIAAGVPVVASDAGGPREILDGERGGLLVPPRDPHALAAAIRRVLEEPGLAARLSRAGRERSLDYEAGAAGARIWQALLGTVGAQPAATPAPQPAAPPRAAGAGW